MFPVGGHLRSDSTRRILFWRGGRYRRLGRVVQIALSITACAACQCYDPLTVKRAGSTLTLLRKGFCDSMAKVLALTSALLVSSAGRRLAHRCQQHLKEVCLSDRPPTPSGLQLSCSAPDLRGSHASFAMGA